MTPDGGLMTAGVGGLRPARRAGLVIGPGLLCGPATLHVVKDPDAGRVYEIGAREHFVLSRLDGTRTRAQVSSEYAAEFGRPLNEGPWYQLLGLLAARGLLAGERPAARAADAPPAARHGLLRGEAVLGYPSAFLHQACARAGNLLRPAVIVPLAVALAIVEGVTLALLPTLVRQGVGLFHQPSLIVPVFALVWGTTVVHELAHGLACVRAGGDATRIGLRWRLPVIQFYCTTEDLPLVSASGRLAAGGAGLLADMAVQVPILALWLWLPRHDPTSVALAALLAAVSARVLVNLLPLPSLDGYAMLSPALGTSRLAASTLRYVTLLARRDPARLAYPSRASRRYIGYAVLLAATVLAVIAAAALAMAAWPPARYAAAACGALAMLSVLRMAGLRLGARYRAARQPIAPADKHPALAVTRDAAPASSRPHSPEEPTMTMTAPSPASVAAGTVPAVNVEGVSKAYGTVMACRDVTLTIHRGEMFGLLGPNGAGKTTLIEIIEGLRRPDSGTVTVLGRAPWPRDPALGLRVGVQTQSAAFFPRLTAREHLRTVAACYGLDAAAADRAAVRFGVDGYADTRVERLSGGQRQRLAVGAALVHDPDLVFLDEPTAALDPVARRDLWRLLREIRDQGKTIVYTTHHLDEAEALCDRVAILDGGSVVACGAPRDLVDGLGEPVRVLVPAGRISAGEAIALAGVESASAQGTCLALATRDPAAVLSAVTSLVGPHGVSTRAATLEDVYLQLTGTEYQS